MNIELIIEKGITSFAIIVNIVLGLLTYYKNPKSHTNRLFFYLTVIIAMYLFANYQSLHQTTALMTLFWVRAVMGFAVGINLLFFLFVTVFPQIHISLSKKTLWILSLTTLILFILTQTNIIFSSFNIRTSQPNPGPGVPLFLLHTILLLGGGVLKLIVKLKRTKGIQKKQLWYVFLGAILMFSAIIISNVVLVLVFKISSFVGFLPLYTLIFVGFVAYAIVRHRLLDIQFIVARSVTYTLLVLFLGLIYSLGVFFVRYVITGVQITRTELISSALLALTITVSFQPLIHIFDKITHKLFFRGGYDLHKVLPRFNSIITSTILLKDLTQLILVELETYLKMSGGYIVVFDKTKIIWKQSLIPNEVISDSFIDDILRPKSSNISRKIIVFEEQEDTNIKEKMRKAKINIIVPLFTKDTLIGAIFLGEKSSGEIYSVQDIETLQIIGPELSVGMKNALSYDEIRRFNQTLKEKIEKATTELISANVRLKELDKLKDEFVSVTSHELRTPLTAIRSYLWLAIEGKGGQLTEKLKYYLDRSYSSTVRLINLVNDILNISRIESGRMSFKIDKIDLVKLVKEVFDEVRPRAEELKIELRIMNYELRIQNLEFRMDQLSVIGDIDKIKEVLINLIGNSLKFTKEKGLIEISFEEKDNKIITNVKDDGEGLAQEDIPKLFQKFGMIQNSYVTNQKAAQGTGLGLFICKTIIEKLGGEIWVSSMGKGKGATFSFSLIKQNPTDLLLLQKKLTNNEGLGLVHSEV